MMVAPSTPRAHYVDRPWWTAHERDESPYQDLWAMGSALRRRQSTLQQNTKRLMAMYQWGAKATEAWEDSAAPLDYTTNYYNAAQNVIDTVHAKICKTEIRPMPLTEGGGYLARRRARRLGEAIEGVFDDCDFERVKEDVVMDALTTDHGAGAAYVFRENGRLCIEYVPIDDIYFDDAEARYRSPRCLYRRMLVDRYVLLARYGKEDPALYGTVEERRDAILRAPVANALEYRQPSDHDQIEVWMAWHLPSAAPSENDEGSGDGRHAIVIATATLYECEWKRPRFPIPIYVPRQRRRHIWGLSMMRALAAPEAEYEKLTEKIQRAHAKTGAAQWMVPRSANMDIRELGNGIGVAGEFDGPIPPTSVPTEPVAPGAYNYHASIPALMMQHVGVSSMSAHSEIPAGLQQASGKALQVFDDAEAERLLPFHKPLSRWTVDIMWCLVDEVEEALTEDESFTSRYRGRDSIELHEWKELLGQRVANDNGNARFKRDFDFKVVSVSNLAKKPSALFAQLTEMLNSGAISVEQFRRLFGLPDLEAENDLDSSDVDVIDLNLDTIVVRGEYNSPEPFDNLELAYKRGGKFYNLVRAKGGVPEERMDMLRDWLAEVKAQIDKKNAAAQAGAPGPGASPMPPPGAAPGMPMPPPGPPMPPPGAPPMPQAA